jgi:hypothetical protein
MNDAELVSFATEFREGILGDDPPDMMCFAVCAPLVTLLGLYGVPATMVEGDVYADDIRWCNHFWLKLVDGRVLDPTADQFNSIVTEPLPAVYLGPPADIHRATPPESAPR